MELVPPSGAVEYVFQMETVLQSLYFFFYPSYLAAQNLKTVSYKKLCTFISVKVHSLAMTFNSLLAFFLEFYTRHISVALKHESKDQMKKK